MRADVLDALSGRFPARVPSKESLDHPGIISRVAGFDVYEDTPRAFEIAWRRLGIDIHVPPPTGNAPHPRVPGGTWEEKGRRFSDYGVFPTGMPVEPAPAVEKQDDDWVFRYDVSVHDFDLAAKTAELRAMSGEFRARFKDLAVLYHLYYTTIFMWPVVTFGWESFLLAAASDPERFEEVLWKPWARISRKNFEALAAMDEEVVFCHDDLAMSTGPIFPPEFYERYIFSRYPWILEPAVKAGKKIVFVSDGNIDAFLERLLEFPFAGLMYETPATPYERVLATWGKAGRGFIGGISTGLLTARTPAEVRAHTREVMRRGREYPGFIVSSCGQLPGNIPLANMLAYFETRHELGCPAEL
jgi:hypothetical protein